MPPENPRELRLPPERELTRELIIVSWNVNFKAPLDLIPATIRQIEKELGCEVDIFCLTEIPIESFEEGAVDEQALFVADGLRVPRDNVLFVPQVVQRNERFSDEEDTMKWWSSGSGIYSRYPFAAGSEAIYKLREGKTERVNFFREGYKVVSFPTVGIAIPGREQPFRIGLFQTSIFTAMPWERRQEVRALARAFKDCDMAVGDGNVRPNSRMARRLGEVLPLIETVGGHTFADTYSLGRVGPFPLWLPVERTIDLGFAKPELQARGGVEKRYRGMSDHYPVIYRAQV